jgi:hypothetical protein
MRVFRHQILYETNERSNTQPGKGLNPGRYVDSAVFLITALIPLADRVLRQGNSMREEQILLNRARAQAAKALVAFIDEDRNVLTPSGCPYKRKTDRPRVGLKKKVAKRIFATFNGLTLFSARSKRRDNGDSEILQEQVELLGKALTKIIVELEIIRGDMPLLGPQAFLFADDALQTVKQLKAREYVSF